LAEIAAAAMEDDLARLDTLLTAKGAAGGFLAAVFDLSPFLRDLARRRPLMLDALFEQTVEERLAALVAEIAGTGIAEDMSEAALMAALRERKSEAHFLIALADLAGEADTH